MFTLIEIIGSLLAGGVGLAVLLVTLPMSPFFAFALYTAV